MTATAKGMAGGAAGCAVRESASAARADAHSEAPTPEVLRRAFGSFATGVAVIGARSAEGEVVGMTANSLTSVSISPPLVLFCPARSLIAFNVYATAQHFSVTILPKHSEWISNHFARSGVDKWKAMPHSFGLNGAPYLDDALATMECTVVDRHEAGDHLIVLGRVLRLNVSNAGEPLIFFRSRYCSLDPHVHSVEPAGSAPFEAWG